MDFCCRQCWNETGGNENKTHKVPDMKMHAFLTNFMGEFSSFIMDSSSLGMKAV